VSAKILAERPLPTVFAKLQGAEAGGKEESDLCTFLEKIFQTTPGSALLRSAMPYAAAGLAAPAPRVRRLACAQLGRAMAQLDDDTDDAMDDAAMDEVETTTLPSLVEALADEDSGVAAVGAHHLLTAVHLSKPHLSRT
jgi:hypothetical protein